MTDNYENYDRYKIKLYSWSSGGFETKFTVRIGVDVPVVEYNFAWAKTEDGKRKWKKSTWGTRVRKCIGLSPIPIAIAIVNEITDSVAYIDFADRKGSSIVLNKPLADLDIVHSDDSGNCDSEL